jgi:hypothetical protein
MKRPLLALLALVLAGSTRADDRATSCTLCHARAEIAGDGSPAIVEHEREGAHAAVGLSCHDCHGGNPDPALAEDIGAMDEDFTAAPFVGTPERAAIPAFCGRCHSSPTYMRRFRPDARIDQEREYWTSGHGERLRGGDTKVATCTDCHGTHGILAPGDARSPVHAQRVADTCGHCHADAARMAGYRLADGRPMPLDQLSQWRGSVHARYLLDRGDLTAPTCNDCHGNHGAAPPGVDSVAFVCGQCHGREAELFRASPKAAAFEAHREYMQAAGATGCAGCHTPPSPLAALGKTVSFTQCATCHGYHGIARATTMLLEPLPAKPCDFCHETAGGAGGLLEASAAAQRRYESTVAGLVQRAREEGLDGAARFDWLLDRALEIPAHIRPTETPGASRLGPEFARLFDKFRMGKTHGLTRCGQCHASGDAGSAVGQAFVDHMRQLTTATARAERLQLAAQRGGVSVRNVASHVDGAVATQIELEVLVHTFSTAPDGKFMTRHREGMAHAQSAIAGARSALDELGNRRRGLAVFLGFLVVVLIAMVLKIRQRTDED